MATRLGRPALLLVALALGCAPRPATIRSGDLLFQDLDCGPTCDAIEGVTTSFGGWRLSHVAIAELAEDGEVFILEAYDGVSRVPLDAFLARTKGRYLHGRLRAELAPVARRAVEAARALLGRAYDPVFDITNDRYYCSELVHEVYRGDDGQSLFPLSPMDFGDPQGEKNPWWAVWAAYFEKLGLPVPAGEPGTNPGAISRSPHLEILDER